MSMVFNGKGKSCLTQSGARFTFHHVALVVHLITPVLLCPWDHPNSPWRVCKSTAGAFSQPMDGKSGFAITHVFHIKKETPRQKMLDAISLEWRWVPRW